MLLRRVNLRPTSYRLAFMRFYEISHFFRYLPACLVISWVTSQSSTNLRYMYMALKSVFCLKGLKFLRWMATILQLHAGVKRVRVTGRMKVISVAL